MVGLIQLGKRLISASETDRQEGGSDENRQGARSQAKATEDKVISCFLED